MSGTECTPEANRRQAALLADSVVYSLAGNGEINKGRFIECLSKRAVRRRELRQTTHLDLQVAMKTLLPLSSDPSFRTMHPI